MSKYVADFETTTYINDCRVWAYSIINIEDLNNFKYGNNIDDFMKLLENSKENMTIFFHNLKFDIEFILNWLFRNGFSYVKSKKERKDKTFTTLISDTGQFYSCEVYFKVENTKKINYVKFYDSLKIIPFPVDEIAKKFDLPISKLSIDYTEYRSINHRLTDEEVAYIKNDVEIVARALYIFINRHLTKMTIGSNALSFYKLLNKNFDKYYPVLPFEIDADIRKSYKGGFTYLNPYYKNKEVGKGLVLDVNSLYPSVLKYARLPYGNPIYFDGEYKEDKLYNLYIQSFSCSFKLKKNKIPTIQLKSNLAFLPNEYIESTDGDIVNLVLTNIDLKLFFENYDITSPIIYHGGWKFKSICGLFSNYVDYWSDEKINAKKRGDKGMYTIAKLFLNSLYGKFGLNPKVRSKYPIFEDNKVKYKFHDEEIRDSIYVAVASFVTSYAREKTIRSSQKIRDYSLKNYGDDYYIYSDTDSIHLKYIDKDILKSILDIDDYILGYWKIESEFVRAKFLRQKCYIELSSDDIMNVTISGLPKHLVHLINFDNFKVGFTTEDFDIEKKKLTYTHCEGGIVLTNTEFTIKE